MVLCLRVNIMFSRAMRCSAGNTYGQIFPNGRRYEHFEILWHWQDRRYSPTYKSNQYATTGVLRIHWQCLSFPESKLNFWSILSVMKTMVLWKKWSVWCSRTSLTGTVLYKAPFTNIKARLCIEMFVHVGKCVCICVFESIRAFVLWEVLFWIDITTSKSRLPLKPTTEWTNARQYVDVNDNQVAYYSKGKPAVVYLHW